MQWLWLIPSLAFGIYLYATTGQAYGLVFGVFAAVSSLVAAYLQHRKVAIDESAAVRFGKDAVAIGNRVLPKREFLWKPAWRNRVYAELSAQNSVTAARVSLERKISGSLACAKELALTGWLGFTGSNEVTLDLAADGAHAIIVGATGSGKSQLLTTWLVSLCQGYPPETLQILAIDYKGGAALTGLSQTPWCRAFFTDLEPAGVSAALADLNTELAQRELICAEAKVSRIEDLASPPARLLVVVDELQALLADPNLARPLEAVAARGRSLGVHLLLTAQSLSGVPRALLTNLGARIAVGKTDPVELAQLGYVRAESAQPISAAPNETHRWASALLITPEKQVRFAFPSLGLVGWNRLSRPSAQDFSVDFQAREQRFDTPEGQNASESVEKPAKNFVFRIGL